MVVGVLGSVLGMVFGYSVVIAGMQEVWLTVYLPLGCLAMAVGVAGLVGAALARRHRQPSWILLGGAGVALLLVISVSYIVYPVPHVWLWSLSGILLIVGSALEFGRCHQDSDVEQGSPDPREGPPRLRQ